jgi:hypothetical protein
MGTIFSLLIDLVTLLLVLARSFLKAAAFVVIALGVLWLVGNLFPYVMVELGFPCDTVYDCLQRVVESISSLSQSSPPIGPAH